MGEVCGQDKGKAYIFRAMTLIRDFIQCQWLSWVLAAGKQVQKIQEPPREFFRELQ
jgi:hypothetical protein